MKYVQYEVVEECEDEFYVNVFETLEEALVYASSRDVEVYEVKSESTQIV